MVEFSSQTDFEVYRVLTTKQPSPSPNRFSATPMFDRFTPSIKAKSTEGKLRSPNHRLFKSRYSNAKVSPTPFNLRSPSVRLPKSYTRKSRLDPSTLGKIEDKSSSPNPISREHLRLPNLKRSQLPTCILQKRIDHPYRNGRFSDSLNLARM